jgi:hypothetical protein
VTPPSAWRCTALRKLKVPIYSVQQGELGHGLVAGVYALLDEQYAADLAAKMVLAMPEAVRHGMYPARTPIGYKRVWPEGQEYSRLARPEMVEDEDYGPLVREHVFGKYARGWSMTAIVRFLNSQPLRNPESPRGLWNINWVSRTLRNPIYVAEIAWGRSKRGHYESYQGPVLRSGVEDCGPARHKPLIERAVWEACQVRLQNDDQRTQTTTRRASVPALLSGFLRCQGCGGSWRAQRQHQRQGRHGTSQYYCAARSAAQSPCREPGVAMALADDAVLREVARLRPGRPWTPDALDEVLEHDPHAEERARVEAEIAAARREVERNIRLLKLIDEPDGETLAAFRRDNQALDQRIKSLQAYLETLPCTTEDPLATEGLYARLAGEDLAARIASHQADGDVPALRALLAATVQSAHITERRGGARNGRSAWVRAEVTWTPPVQRFLAHGYLLLDPPAEAPKPLTRAERMRRYRAERRAERGQVAVPEGLLNVSQAAQELGITPAALRGAIRRQVITPLRVLQRNYLTRAELERYRTEHLGRRGRHPHVVN